MKKALLPALLLASIATPQLSYAEVLEDKPSVGAMLADTLLVRPVYFFLSQAGALIYTATLPFTVLGGNADEAAETLVVTPLQATFLRCLGCGSAPTEVSKLEEGFGKEITHFVQLSAGSTINQSEGDSVAGTGFGLYAGTHFELMDRSRFDVMLGYKNLGEFELDTDDDRTVKDSLVSYQLVSRFGKQIFSRTDLMFKFGLHNWQASREVLADSVGSSAGSKGDTDGFSYLWGAGVDFSITENLKTGLEYTRYDISSGELDYEAGVNTLDLNLSLHF